MAIVNEVITQFGFQGSISPLTDYNSALGKSIGLLAGMAAGIVAAAGAIAAFTTSTTQALDPMIQLSRTTGVAVESLQELGYVASVTGSDAQALQGSIAGLSEKIGEAAQKGSEEFARLGISVRDVNGEVKAADAVMAEIGQRFNTLNLSLAERRSFAQSLGIDPSLIQLLSLTGAEMDKTRAKARALGIVTTEQAEAAASLNDSMTTLRFGLDGLRNTVAVGLAPQIEEITSGFIDFLAANRDVISEGISKTLEVITALAKAVVRLTPIISGIVVAFGVWKVASIGLGAVLATVFSPVTLIVAGITALLLIVDDLIVAMNGGQSVIADFFQEFFGIDIVPPIRAALDAIAGLFDGFKALVGQQFETLKNLVYGFVALFHGEFDDAGAFFGEFLKGTLAIFDTLFGGLFAKFGEFTSRLIGAFKAIDFKALGLDIAESITTPIRELFDELVTWITGKFEKIAGAAQSVADFFSFGDDEPEQPPASPEAQRFRESTAVPRMLDDEQLDDLNVMRNINFVTRGGEVSAPQAQQLDRPVTVRDLVTVAPGLVPDAEEPQAQQLDRPVTVRDLVTVAPDLMPDAEGPEAQQLDRPVTVRDLVTVVPDLVAPVEPVDPAEMVRSVALLNQFEQSGDAPAPTLSPLALTRAVSVDNQVSNAGIDLAALAANDSLTIEAQAQQRLAPQPQNINNNNARSVTIEQNNEFKVTGDGARSVSNRIANTLQDQLNDASTQLPVGGF